MSYFNLIKNLPEDEAVQAIMDGLVDVDVQDTAWRLMADVLGEDWIVHPRAIRDLIRVAIKQIKEMR